jgi:hypothetical protein
MSSNAIVPASAAGQIRGLAIILAGFAGLGVLAIVVGLMLSLK